MTKPTFTPKRIEEAARTSDAIERARRFSDVTAPLSADRLRRPVDGMDERFGFAADDSALRL